MKQILSFVIVSSLILASCNQADKTPADIAAIIKDSSKYTAIQWADTTIDFGSKKMGEVVNITFLCTNTGNKPLYLYDVRPSCGCTLVDYSKEAIEPGKQGKIDAQFDTKKSHPGEVHKTVFVHSNSNNGTRYLSFSGTILPADSATSVKN
mgnify:FL=1